MKSVDLGADIFFAITLFLLATSLLLIKDYLRKMYARCALEAKDRFS